MNETAREDKRIPEEGATTIASNLTDDEFNDLLRTEINRRDMVSVGVMSVGPFKEGGTSALLLKGQSEDVISVLLMLLKQLDQVGVPIKAVLAQYLLRGVVGMLEDSGCECEACQAEKAMEEKGNGDATIN